MSAEDELQVYEPYYNSFKDEVLALLLELREQHKTTVDIYDIDWRVKSAPSIEHKITSSNGKFARLTDLQDIVGARVICHCISDTDRFDAILNEELAKKYSDIDRQPRSGKSGYRGIHYIIKKDFVINGRKEILFCEIQLRTVLQDAWAIQSHLYNYKRKAEGDADILSQVVSGILNNCENLWELVKKSTKGKEDVGSNEVSMIYEDISDKVISVGRVSAVEGIEKLISSNKSVEVDDFLDAETQHIKKVWDEAHAKAASPEQAVGILEEMELAMNPIISVGLLAIKHEKINILRRVLDKFGPIISFADRKDGYTVILSVPSASVHNAYYYLAIHALLKLSGAAIHLLLNYKVERDHNGRLYYFRVWESGAIFAPEVVHGAEKMFNRLKEDFAKNDLIKKFIAVDTDEFLSLACQFNMLFCLKAVAEEEAEGKKPWAYPNFGRFYANRISKFIERIKNREDFKKFIEEAMDEKLEVFADKFNGRIGTLAERGLGSGYFWESIKKWENER
ncbi:MAG: RelA/SpoT domain-containing protein [bacterium]|nr:RelA/SpoT domain-containing protein [bacterium]